MIYCVFIMNVIDIFHFTDGRTVFVGYIFGYEKFIHKCRCTLFLDDQQICELSIEGEMLVEKRYKSEKRSLSTLDNIRLTLDSIIDHRCILICTLPFV